MKYSNLQNIQNIINNSSLAKIMVRTQLVNNLNEYLKTHLPTKYGDYFKIINIRDNKVIISVPSATYQKGFTDHKQTFINVLKSFDNNLNMVEFIIDPNFKK